MNHTLPDQPDQTQKNHSKDIYIYTSLDSEPSTAPGAEQLLKGQTSPEEKDHRLGGSTGHLPNAPEGARGLRADLARERARTGDQTAPASRDFSGAWCLRPPEQPDQRVPAAGSENKDIYIYTSLQSAQLDQSTLESIAKFDAAVSDASGGPAAPGASLDRSAYRTTSLGNITRFASAFENDRIVERFFLQNVARDLLPGERVGFCLRHRVFGAETIDIRHDAECERAYYANLMTCGSVWSCPVCAAKISERRRYELTQALEVAREKGYFPLLITQTLRHNASDKLSDLLTELQDAARRFKSGRVFQRVRQRFGIVGTISALEVTHGQENGWHPHRHELWILDHEPDQAELDELRELLRERWLKVLKRYDATWERGLTVERDTVDGYIAKFGREPVHLENSWTLAHEVAKSPVKRGREGRRGPFQLLADHAGGDDLAGALFREYALTFKGRRQLFWSRGLRQLLALPEEDESDDTIAAAVSPVDRVLAQLTIEQWRVVKRNEARGRLLQIANSGNLGAVWDFLDSLPGMAQCAVHYDARIRKASTAAAVLIREGDRVSFMDGRQLQHGYVTQRIEGRVEVETWNRERRYKVWLNAADVHRSDKAS